MTTEKALEILKNEIVLASIKRGRSTDECEALDKVIEDAEKQIVKKPKFYGHNYHCICCNNLVGNNEFEWQRFLYCDKCGQKLDWSE